MSVSANSRLTWPQAIRVKITVPPTTLLAKTGNKKPKTASEKPRSPRTASKAISTEPAKTWMKSPAAISHVKVKIKKMPHLLLVVASKRSSNEHSGWNSR